MTQPTVPVPQCGSEVLIRRGLMQVSMDMGADDQDAGVPLSHRDRKRNLQLDSRRSLCSVDFVARHGMRWASPASSGASSPS